MYTGISEMVATTDEAVAILVPNSHSIKRPVIFNTSVAHYISKINLLPQSDADL